MLYIQARRADRRSHISPLRPDWPNRGRRLWESSISRNKRSEILNHPKKCLSPVVRLSKRERGARLIGQRLCQVICRVRVDFVCLSPPSKRIINLGSAQPGPANPDPQPSGARVSCGHCSNTFLVRQPPRQHHIMCNADSLYDVQVGTATDGSLNNTVLLQV